jgi:DNA-binding NtrC family response regulator
MTLRQAIEQVFGNKCSSCGAAGVPFEFHHESPEGKTINIGRGTHRDAIEELEKCVMLCKPCHRRRHRKPYRGKRLPFTANIVPIDNEVDSFERGMIVNAMVSCSGNKASAARMLNIKPGALYYKLHKYNLI